MASCFDHQLLLSLVQITCTEVQGSHTDELINSCFVLLNYLYKLNDIKEKAQDIFW